MTDCRQEINKRNFIEIGLDAVDGVLYNIAVFCLR